MDGCKYVTFLFITIRFWSQFCWCCHLRDDLSIPFLLSRCSSHLPRSMDHQLPLNHPSRGTIPRWNEKSVQGFPPHEGWISWYEWRTVCHDCDKTFSESGHLKKLKLGTWFYAPFAWRSWRDAPNYSAVCCQPIPKKKNYVYLFI